MDINNIDKSKNSSRDSVMKSDFSVGELKCNYLVDPLGVETPFPLLSWVLHSSQRGQEQSSYRIMAASSYNLLKAGKTDLWDTGKVKSNQSTNISYAGKPLQSSEPCYWKVYIWDINGEMTGESAIAFFQMGLLKESDWKAKWICSALGATDIDKAISAPLFRKSFIIEKKVVKATAYICGLGYQELYINGSKIGEDVLAPAFTRYDKTVLYNTYDISNCFVNGENVIGVILGNGWYNTFTKDAWDYRQAPWRHHPKLIFQAQVILEDGEELILGTNETWKVSKGPIVFDGLRNGEYYDARLEVKDWNKPGFDDSIWPAAHISKGPGGILQSFQMTPIRVTGTIKPVALKEVAKDVWVYDLGQNISGWAQLRVSGPCGTEVVLRYAEQLNEDGSINTSEIDKFVYSGEYQTDKYTLKGEGQEIWEPRFTYHGFRYIEVTGFPGNPTLDNICGCVVHTAFDSSGEFECSNALLNKIQNCARWSTLTNYHGMPTDCPQREKNGWTGDALLSAEQVLLNFNPMTAYTKWMRDFKAVQRLNGQLPGVVPTGGWGFNWGSGPAWDSAMVLIPWYMYVYNADSSILNEMYENMKQYVDFMTSMSSEYLVDFGLGDWCPPIGGPDAYKCPTVITDTAYYYVDAEVVSKVARILGKAGDSEKYEKLARNIRNAFRLNFLDTESGIVKSNCQTALSCALYQGLVNDEEKQRVLEKLIEQVEEQDRHIDCGILGTKYMLHTLTDLGRADLAYAIATQTTFPSWGNWIMKGATTLWETWDGKASRNHHMFSDISAWFYKGLAGINPDVEKPGFRHFIIKPNPVGDLTWVKAWHESIYGRIVCNWRVEHEEFRLELEIPVGSSATLYLPTTDPDSVYESEKCLNQGNVKEINRIEKSPTVMLKLESGRYSFSAKYK